MKKLKLKRRIRRVVNKYIELWLTNHLLLGTCRTTEDRFVMATHLGRNLKRWEIVHHKDGNRHNNALENLEIISQAEHCKIHNSHPCTPERTAAISAAKKGKPQPWAVENGKNTKGTKRSDAFKKEVSEGMKKYVATLPDGEMARRAKK